MRFVIATPYFPTARDATSGVFIYRQALALRDRGHEVRVIHIEPRPPIGWRQTRRWRDLLRAPVHDRVNGFEVFRARYLSTTQRVGLRRFQSAAIAHAVGRVMQRHPMLREADVLYAQWLVPFGAGCLIAARRIGMPCMAIARGGDLNLWSQTPALRRQLSRVLEEADAVLGNGRYVRDELVRLLGYPPSRPIEIVHNPYDLSAFFAVDRRDAAALEVARKVLGLPVAAKLLLFLGQLDDRKGPDLALRAFAQLDDSWQFVVAGEGPLASSLRALAQRLRVATRVHFLGAVAPSHVPRLLTACDALALPSRRDGLANVLVEALATAMPVVATPVGGAAEIVISGKTGWLVPVEDTSALAAALSTIGTAPAMAAARGQAGRAVVRELFDVTRNLEHLEAVVRRIGGTRKAVAA